MATGCVVVVVVSIKTGCIRAIQCSSEAIPAADAPRRWRASRTTPRPGHPLALGPEQGDRRTRYYDIVCRFQHTFNSRSLILILAHFVAKNTHTRARAYIHTATVPGTQPFVGVANSRTQRNATLSVGCGPQGLAVALVVMPALAQHGLRAAVQPRLGPNTPTHARTRSLTRTKHSRQLAWKIFSFGINVSVCLFSM